MYKNYKDYITNYIWQEFFEGNEEEFIEYTTDDLSDYVYDKLVVNLGNDESEQLITGSLNWVCWYTIQQSIDSNYYGIYCRNCGTPTPEISEYCSPKCQDQYYISITN
tara:strand:+ start:296 stop:619 length:324 start_codon:yes stop_codon:yes gene_type:complete